jgi:lysozyme
LYDDKPISFIYIKATEGSSYVDPRYKKNYTGAKSKSILIGSYHFFRTSSAVTSQFKNFKETISNYPQDLRPMVDIEEFDKWKGKAYIDSLDKFLKLIEGHYGKKPILYTSNNFYNQYLSEYYLDYDLWIARYNKKKPKLNNNRQWLIWQCTKYAKVKGIQNRVDINLIKTKKQLTSLKL